MAPPPEYDKEPKAPDKSATNISSEDSKLLHNLLNDQHTNSDYKPTNTVAAVEVENNKHVETLDDGQLRALLDEAITYKCPKDREGKSSLFKELLEEVEQDEQACEAAARTLSGCRGARRGGRGRRALPHSNSLQDLVAALAAEPAPRRHHVRHHPPAPAHSNVSARAIHGGSLPSGVDTSSLLSEEPARGAGYLATVRCVNPPPLAERRVSASDANTPAEMELLNRRSKPMFPMTYTARATLEIGSGSVCTGRAVTTTTASNQVRTALATTPPHQVRTALATTPPHQVRTALATTPPHQVRTLPDSSPHPPSLPPPPRTTGCRSQIKLMNALRPKNKTSNGGGLSGKPRVKGADIGEFESDHIKPRGPEKPYQYKKENKQCFQPFVENEETLTEQSSNNTHQWADHVDNWYKSLSNYIDPLLGISNKEKTKINPKNTQDLTKDYESTQSTKMENICFCPYEVKNRQKKIPDLSLSVDPNYHMSYLLEENRFNKLLTTESQNIGDVGFHYDNIHKVVENVEHDKKCDISLRRKYRKKVGDNLVIPTLAEVNPRNVRRMTIGLPHSHVKNIYSANADNLDKPSHKMVQETKFNSSSISLDQVDEALSDIKSKSNTCVDSSKYTNTPQQICDDLKCYPSYEVEKETCISNPFEDLVTVTSSFEIELNDVNCSHFKKNSDDSFSQYVSNQQRFFLCINNSEESTLVTTAHIPEEEILYQDSSQKVNLNSSGNTEYSMIECPKTVSAKENVFDALSGENMQNMHGAQSDHSALAQLPNSAYLFITLPEPMLSPLNSNVKISPDLTELENNSSKPLAIKTKPNLSKKKKPKMPPEHPDNSDRKKTALDKKIFKVLLFENLLKNNDNETHVGNLGASAIADKEVDSAISFSCITTPEVVSSCNTTSSTVQSAVAVDPKPRSVISSSFNGLPLSRPNYGSTCTSVSDDYKKSLDENGNSVQGFSSPLSGSSQHKKPRRKKSSKNETVIDCQQIDGYQGDKDVNELLRFIESNADNGRSAKLGRIKHKDDSDDKTSKKRSTERRKEKDNKMKRATSMEELSRTKIEDLTEAPLRTDKKERRSDVAPAKAERRSWGDDARDALLYDAVPDAAAAAAAELTDFQTVTKKRKPRRRTDEHEREPPRRARAPSPRARRESAPPSDRSNDSNDDMDSVHSLPAAPPPAPPAAAPPAPHASYAEIARTRHNIPDLIESCNFYAEGEGGAAPADADGYPVLDARAAAARPRDAKPPPPAPRRDRKERAPPAPDAPRAPDCPAPDVVADRRPPVILLDSAVRSRDMDGVTFGFDINEQLLSGGGRRPRCDLLRDAPEAAPGGGAGAGGAAWRFVAPPAPAATAQLLQIVDYVGAAWEDVVRCGGGKVRYFSE